VINLKTLISKTGSPGNYEAIIDVDGTQYKLHNTDNLSEAEWLCRVADTPVPLVSEEVVAELMNLKPEVIVYIKTNPTCTLEDCLAVFQPTLLSPTGVIGRYMEIAYSRGFIPAPVFEAFRAMICAMTPEQLMEL